LHFVQKRVAVLQTFERLNPKPGSRELRRDSLTIEKSVEVQASRRVCSSQWTRNRLVDGVEHEDTVRAKHTTELLVQTEPILQTEVPNEPKRVDEIEPLRERKVEGVTLDTLTTIKAVCLDPLPGQREHLVAGIEQHEFSPQPIGSLQTQTCGTGCHFEHARWDQSVDRGGQRPGLTAVQQGPERFHEPRLNVAARYRFVTICVTNRPMAFDHPLTSFFGRVVWSFCDDDESLILRTGIVPAPPNLTVALTRQRSIPLSPGVGHVLAACLAPCAAADLPRRPY
jgi:hypothetical protein